MLLSFDFGNIFVLIFLNISDIEAEDDSDIDKSKNFNVSVWIYLAFEGEYKEFTVIGINFSTVKNNGEKYLYNEDNFYFEPNNVGYNDII